MISVDEGRCSPRTNRHCLGCCDARSTSATGLVSRASSLGDASGLLSLTYRLDVVELTATAGRARGERSRCIKSAPSPGLVDRLGGSIAAARKLSHTRSNASSGASLARYCGRSAPGDGHERTRSPFRERARPLGDEPPGCERPRLAPPSCIGVRRENPRAPAISRKTHPTSEC